MTAGFHPSTLGRRTLLTRATLLVAMSLIATAGGGVGCSSEACTLAACLEGVDVELSTPLSAADSYLVRVSTPEADYEQTVTPGTIYNRFVDIISVEVEDGLIRAVQLNGHTPSSIVVLIERDGQIVFDAASDRIKYEGSYPNGADCDSGCRVARIKL